MSDELHIKPDGSWEFNGEDSRLRNPEKNAIPNFRLWNPITQRFEWHVVYRTYCKNCGVEGAISSRHSPMVVWFCDKCWEAGVDHTRYLPMLPHAEWCWRNGLPEPKD